MASPRLLKVCDVDGWSLVSRTWGGSQASDWLLTPAHTTEGPVLVFTSSTAAHEYVRRHGPPAGR